MAARPKLTPEQRQRIIAVMIARRALPSDKQLARELGISVSSLYKTMERMLHDLTVSRESKSGKVQAWHSPARSPTSSGRDS